MISLSVQLLVYMLAENTAFAQNENINPRIEFPKVSIDEYMDTEIRESLEAEENRIEQSKEIEAAAEEIGESLEVENGIDESNTEMMNAEEGIGEFLEVEEAYPIFPQSEPASDEGIGESLEVENGIDESNSEELDAAVEEEGIGEFLETEENRIEQSDQANILQQIGKRYSQNNQFEEALDALEKALEIYQELGDCTGEGIVLRSISSLYTYPDVARVLNANSRLTEASVQNLADAEDVEVSRLSSDSQSTLSPSSVSRRNETDELSGEPHYGRQVADGNRGGGESLRGILRSELLSDAPSEVAEGRQNNRELISEIIPGSAILSTQSFESGLSHLINLDLQVIGQYEVAIRYNQAALKIFEETGDEFNRGLTLNEAGLIYEKVGQYYQAVDVYQQAYDLFEDLQEIISQGSTANNLGEIYRKIGNYSTSLEFYEMALKNLQNVPEYKAATLNNIGLVYQALGQFDIALSFYQQSLRLREKVNDIRGQGLTLHNIGFAHGEMNEQDLALDYYQQALRIRERQDVNDVIGQATTLNNLGLLYSEENNHEKAIEILNEAQAIFEEFGARPNIGNTLDSLGTAYKNQGNYNAALDYYNQALAILQDVGDRSGVGIVHTNMGDLYEQQGNPEKAIQEYENAITESIEPIWSDLRGEDLQVSYADKHVDTYTKLIRLLWTQGRYEDAFNYTERARARIFLNQVASGPTDFLNSTATPDLAQEQSLRTDIEDLNNQILSLNRLPASDSHTAMIAQLRVQLFIKQNDYESLLNRLKREDADLVSVSPATLSEIQVLLDKDTTLVSYFVMDDQTLAFVITHDDLQPITLAPGRQALEDKIHMLYAYDFAALDNDHPARLQTLHEWLIEPLNLQSNTKVEIAPHNLLHYVPFAGLTDGEEYLSDRHTLSQLPSASVKRFLEAKRKPQTNTLMALGNPTFDLIFAGQEAETISKMYDTPVLTGSAATESVVRSSANQSEILHLATHGDYNPISPLFSSLRLNPDDEHSDGRLYVHEIYGLDLSDTTNLVVLSACQSHVGQLSRGDEIVGLSRAFLYAGTPSVMASLWNIDDQSTSVLMESFYRHLQNGKTKAEALQLAQRETRANEEYAHPYYWAAFALTGDRK